MTEKDFEIKLCKHLRTAASTPSVLSEVRFSKASTTAESLYDLIQDIPYEVIEDDSRWNPFPKLMIDLTAGVTPDIVLRSKISGQNRIYIEVKKKRRLGYGRADSQVLRYLLHLLATTQRYPVSNSKDIRRAVIVAAPTSWFHRTANAEVWAYFIATHGELASAFDVTLGEIHLPES
jgi:hypothetical protein